MMATAAEIIAALDGNPNTGMCKCPAHDDSKPSLHVKEGDGGVLVKCFAGCSQEAVIEALRARGLWPSTGQKVRPARERRRKEDEDRPTLYTAQRLWRKQALGLPAPERYLSGRGITVRPCTLGLLSARDAARLKLRPYPTMVAPIIGSEGDELILVGAQVTALTRDGAAKVESTRGARTTYGAMRGGYI